MRYIRLMDNRNRDAKVQIVTTKRPGKAAIGSKKNYKSQEGKEVKNRRFICATEENNPEKLVSKHADSNTLARELIDLDQEIDIETAGRAMGQSNQVWISKDGEVMYSAKRMDYIFDMNGEIKEIKQSLDQEATVGEDIALPWTGKLIPIEKIIRKYVLASKLQVRHIDGLTFDFLYGMAKELHQKKSMMLLGGGTRGKEPLILVRNGVPFRGFLEGRVEDDTYLLIIHLSNLEIKPVDSSDYLSEDKDETNLSKAIGWVRRILGGK